ncbi:ssDNA-binding Zn-finger/Zn-ribbon topoisomerase 1 [Metabacillus sp. SLBN-84]
MTYVVCQTPKCQHTYPIQDIKPESVNVSCSECGGVLIDENGRANLSRNPHILPVISQEEIERNQKAELLSKREDLARLQKDVDALERQVQ